MSRAHTRRGLAVVIAVGILAPLIPTAVHAIPAAPAWSRSADPSAPKARKPLKQGAVAPVESVGAIATVTDTAPRVAALPPSVATLPGGRVLNPDFPFLSIPDRAKDPAIPITVYDTSIGQGAAQDRGTVWEGILRNGWVQIGAALTPGHGYTVVGYNAELKNWQAMGAFTVSPPSRRSGPATDVGGMSVSLVTGELRWTWQSQTLVGPSDGVGVSLTWLTRGVTPPGLPDRWQLAVSAGSPWAALDEYSSLNPADVARASRVTVKLTDRDRSCDLAIPRAGADYVTLTGWDGSQITFRRTTDGVYTQTTGGVVVPGFTNTLVRCEGGDGVPIWKFTDTQGMTTVFRDGKAIRVSMQDQPIAEMSWTGNRLTQVSNSSGRAITLVYADATASNCPSSSWAKGFSPAPAGMLCRVVYPGDTATEIGYVSGGLASPQIGLVKDPGNQGTTLGWNSRGSLVATRAPLANLAATVDSAAKQAIGRVTLDSQGRVATLTPAPMNATLAPPSSRITYAAITEANLRAPSTPVQIDLTAASGDYAVGASYWVNPATMQVLRTRDKAGMETTSIIDPKTGQVTGTRDALGRTTTYVTDTVGNLKAQRGPYRFPTDVEFGIEQSFSYDTRRIRGEDVPVRGFRVDVYDAARFAGTVTESEFWEVPNTDDPLNISWSGRPNSFSARLAGTWTPSAADDKAANTDNVGWDVQVDVSAGVNAVVVIGAQTCVSSPCRIKGLPDGDKPIRVDLVTARATGFITISAAPHGQPMRAIRSKDIDPGFQRQTALGINDTYRNSASAPAVVYEFADMAAETPTSVRMPGGLTSTMTYEDSAPANDQWGRILSYTTPGGLTQKATYWASSGTVPLPEVCGGGVAVQSGQQATITRIDGSRVTSYFDIQGRLVAQVLEGAASGRQTSCMTYREDGSPRVSSSWNTAGQLIERSESLSAVGGDPLTTATTITLGPGSANGDGTSKTYTTVVNWIGLPVRYTDESGTVTTTSYTSFGDTDTVTVTPPAADDPAITIVNEYRAKDLVLIGTTINGKPLTQIDYQAATGRIQNVAYGRDLAVAAIAGYSGSGQPSRLLTVSGDWTIDHKVSYTPFGRVMSNDLQVTGPKTLTEGRAYTYDGARRLTQADISIETGAKLDRITYGYAYADAQDASCGPAYPRASSDGLRTGGSRDGVDYITCHDAAGRLVSTTDPLVTGDAAGKAIARPTFDGLGRVTGIAGGANDVALDWSSDTTIGTVTDGRGAAAVTTSMTTYGGRVVSKKVVSGTKSSTVLYSYSSALDSSPSILLTPRAGRAPALNAYSLGLPGGATLLLPATGRATLTLPGIDGVGLLTVAAPEFDLPGATGVAKDLGIQERFGPYGEALAPARGARIDATPDYGWQAADRNETFSGPSMITLMGARPYMAALGEFLAPDPALTAGDSLYGYTPGDPINGSDSSGHANEWSWFWQIVSFITVAASIVLGIVSGGWLIPIALGVISTASQILSFKTQTEPSPALDSFRIFQGWASVAGDVLAFGPALVKGLFSAGKWVWNKAASGVSRLVGTRGAGAAESAIEMTTISAGSRVATAPAARSVASAVAKPGRVDRFANWLAKANPNDIHWTVKEICGQSRPYLKALGKFAGKWALVGGAYGFMDFAQKWVPSWMRQLDPEAGPA